MAIIALNGHLPNITNADDAELTPVVASAREHILSAILDLSDVPRPMERAAYYAQFRELAEAWNTCRQPPARTEFVMRLTGRLLVEIDPIVRAVIHRAIRLLQVDSPRSRSSARVYRCKLLTLGEK